MRGAQPSTHTKKKRVQTWSETGQTQMLPCFCRSLEVMTAEEGAVGQGMEQSSLLGPSPRPPPSQGCGYCPYPPSCLPPRITAPSHSAMQFRLRLWRKRDWMERVCGESSRCHCPAGLSSPRTQHPWVSSPVPRTHRCHVPVPILSRRPPARHLRDGVHPVVPLHQLVLRRHPVLSFPHPCGEARLPSLPGRQHPVVTQGHMPQTGTATPCAPALRQSLGNPPAVGAAAFRAWNMLGFSSPSHGKAPAWLGRGWCRWEGCRMLPAAANTMPNIPGPMQGVGMGAQMGLGSTGSLLPEYPKEILEMGLR